jgi:conjugal transfer mating pair stabilization protein TraG
MKRSLAFFFFLAVSLASKAAFALDMEYYTYGGFEQIVGAFSKIALIFSDSGFKAAIGVAMILGILFGAIALVMRAVGGRFSTLSWGVPLMAGYLVYAAMIVPQGRLFIYDPVANRNQAVGGVPDGIVFIAGTMNTIERFVVDTIYTTSTDSMSYQNQAGGRAFNLMYDMAQAGGIPVDADIAASLKRYTDDCVLFELQRPGTTLTANGLATSADFISQYALAASPSIFTVEYPGDNTASCKDAWAVLSTQLTGGAMFNNAMKDACANAGYDVTNAQELAQCTDTLAGVVNTLAGGTGYAAMDIFKQMLIGQTLNDVLLDNSPSLAMRVLANRNAGSSLVGAGMAANEWLPVFKAVMTAVALTLIPFLVIFLPTPLAKKAVSLICGLFVYITAWGAIDAIIHSMAMEYAMTTLSGIITQGQLGMLSLNFFSSGPAKVLAVMGGMRWGGMMLAGAVSAAFVGAGGSVLGQMAGSAIGTAQHAGSSAGMTVGTPEGMARQLSATETAPETMANAAKFRYSDRVNAGMAQKFGTTESGMELVDTFGGVGGAAGVYRQMNTGKAVRFGAGGAAAENMGLPAAYSANTFGAGAQLGEASNLQTMFGNDAQSLANTRTAPQQAFNDTAAARGMKPEDLALTLATKDVVANADTIMKYAQARGGISPHQAAGELGEIAASQNYVNAQSYDKAREVTGEEGQIRTRTNENLNEAAKFAVLSNLAQGLGIAKDNNNFKAMYDYHKMHHGEDSLTLSNPRAVSVLNQRMKDMGYSTRFKAGDRIRMNFDEQGKVVSAFAVRGASRESSDITSEIKGYESNYLNVRRETTGFRGEHGFMDTSFNYKSTIGTGMVEMGRDAAGKPIYGAGFREAYFDRKTGELAAETWTNKRTGQFTGVEYVDTGRKDPQTGKSIKAPQWVTGTMELDKTGSYVVKDFRSISNQEVVRGDGKFVSEMKVDAGSGMRLYEVGRGGQDMASVNKLVLDEQSEARFTIAGGVLADDKSQVTANQERVLWLGAGLQKGLDMTGQARQFRSTFQKPGTSEEPPGGSPTSKDMDEIERYFRRMNTVKNEKAAHRAGNYGTTLPSPAQPKTTFRPRSVETRYPD